MKLPEEVIAAGLDKYLFWTEDGLVLADERTRTVTAIFKAMAHALVMHDPDELSLEDEIEKYRYVL